MIDLLDPILGKGHGNSVASGAEKLIDAHVDGFGQEANRTISKGELGTACVTGAEAPTHIPVTGVFQGIVTGSIVVFDLIVDGNNCAYM